MNEHLKYDIDVVVTAEERNIAETTDCFIFINFSASKHA